MVKKNVVLAVLILALLTSCSSYLGTESITVESTGSGVTFHTGAHALIPRSLSTKAVPYFDVAYQNNKKTADTFFEKKESWASIQRSAQSFLHKFPRAYSSISSVELEYAIAGIVYDELFRRDFADDAEENALRRGGVDQKFYSSTLGIAQISPAIHKATINTALDAELTLEEAAMALLSSQHSIAIIPHILYDNHPSNLMLAITRYHAGTVPQVDERAAAILGDNLQNHLKELRN